MPARLALSFCLAAILSSLGCSSSTGSPVTGAPVAAPTLSVSPTALTFPATTVGQISAVQTVTLSNPGVATVSLASITPSDPTDYLVLSSCGATLAPSATCTLAVTFQPRSAASLPATLTITSNAAASPQLVTLSGSGTAVPVPQAVLSPATLTFPVTTPLATTPAQTVTLTNSGTAPLTLASLTVAGTNLTAFALTANSCTSNSLAAGASCTVGVTFTPLAASATYTASLVATDNSGGVANSTQTVALSGSGAAPAPVAQAVLSPTALSFPGTLSGTSSAVQTITLSNPGNATLTGITISGTAFSAFTQSSTCGSTLAAGASCAIAVTFSPRSTGTFGVTLSVADSATGSPQTATLAGTGTLPQSTLSGNVLSFPNTLPGSTSSAQTVTLSNSGTAPLTISGIALGGTNATSFAESTTCGASVAPAASCTFSVAYSAPATGASSSATITVTSNAASSPQAITLLGSSPSSSSTHTLYTFPEGDLSVTPLYALINGASTTIEMTMYELVDTTFSADLVAACNRGVKVRVILDASLEKSSNTAAYNQLNAVANCSAAWSNTQFQATHQKTFVIDGKQAAIMSLNLTSRYYSTTRDFALITNDPADIAAIESTFSTDYNSTTDFSYQPPPGTDLIWSPTTAQPDLLALINGSTKTLLVENEEMSATNIVSALEAACQRGVQVHIAMTDTGSYHANYSALEAAGCGVHLYPDTATALYIHAKAMVADFGLPTQQVYMGSINFSIASMTQNRELGLYITDSPSVTALNTVITQDYAGANPY